MGLGATTPMVVVPSPFQSPATGIQPGAPDGERPASGGPGEASLRRYQVEGAGGVGGEGVVGGGAGWGGGGGGGGGGGDRRGARRVEGDDERMHPGVGAGEGVVGGQHRLGVAAGEVEGAPVAGGDVAVDI